MRTYVLSVTLAFGPIRPTRSVTSVNSVTPVVKSSAGHAWALGARMPVSSDTSALPPLRAAIGPVTALAILASNMIGTGVFTSLGFQVADLHAGFTLLTLWAVGGVLSLCGALSYAELGAALPHSGGEFVYLARSWSPLVGFLGGFVSMTAGFAAPIALAGIAFGRYAAAVFPISSGEASALVLGVVAVVHWSALPTARAFQVAATTATLLVIVAFIVFGVAVGPVEPVSFAPTPLAWREIASRPFAMSLIYVVYAYTGWNSVGYVAGEIRHPQRVIPRTVMGGVLLVGTLYVLLHWVFLRTVPMRELAGTVEVGALSASRIAGAAGGRIMSGIIALVLVATTSGLVLAGSRATQAVCAGTPGLARWGALAPNGVPRRALLVQFVLVVVLILSASFEKVLAYTGFILNLTSLLTVVGLFRLRYLEPELPRPYRAWGYPFTPLAFIGLSSWILFVVLVGRPLVLVAAMTTFALGGLLYAFTHRTGDVAP